MKQPISSHLITFGVGILIILTMVAIANLLEVKSLLTVQPIPLPPENQAATYIVSTRASQETTISTTAIAEKINLQRKLIVPDSPADVTRIENTIRQAGGVIIETSDTSVVAEFPKESEAQIIQQLESQQLSESIEVDYPIFIAADQVDWGISKIEVPPVWNTTQASGVTVAVVDTGIDYNHSDLRGRYLGGYDFANDDADPFDDNGHGTHVAGTIAADANGGGYQGGASQASLLAVKVLGADGTGYVSDIVDGIDWAMNQGVEVMNFSLGTTYDSSALRNKLEEAQSRGIYLIGAAGNTNGGALLYPAAYSSVISVAATDSNDQFATFSSVGAELTAPGVSITSTVPGGGYASWSGTSMAAPHVSASVALMLANKQENIRTRLHDTALDLGPTGKDAYFGYGRIKAKPAVLGEDVLAPVITFIEPSNGAEVPPTFGVSLDIQDEFEIVAATLSANLQQVASWQSAPYQVKLDATAFLGQEVTLIAQAADNSGNVGATQVVVRVVEELAPSPSPSPTASASAIPISQRAGQSSEVRQDLDSPAQEVRRDTYYAPQELPTGSNSNQRNPQPTPEQSNTPTQSEQSPANSVQETNAESSGTNESNEQQGNSGNTPAASVNRGNPQVKGATTQRLWDRVWSWLMAL